MKKYPLRPRETLPPRPASGPAPTPAFRLPARPDFRLPVQRPARCDGGSPGPACGAGLRRAGAGVAAAQRAVPQQVFRNQLPRKNEFYSYDPPSENPPPETGESVCLQLKSGAHLCRVCGCLGPKTCSRCHQAHYCSKEHQTLDWRLGHKQACTQDHLAHTVPDHNFLFPEFEIVIETEEEIVPEVVEREEDFEITGSMDEALEEELDSMAKHESREDNIFQKFKAQTALEPEQILRYGRGTEPIWISGENIPQEEDIPDCPCGAKRIFEFQVMPQLLNHLKADRLGRSVDWGVLAVFTCAKSCGLGTGYTEEFVWKQDVTDTP